MVDEESEGEQPALVDRGTVTQSDPELVGDGGVEKVEGQRKLEGVLRALVDERRRYALYFLQDNEVSDLDEIATHVAAMEQNVDTAAVSSERIEQVQTSLSHADLPMLEESGLVEFDRRSEAIRYSRPPDLLEKMLRLCATFDAPDG